MEQHSRLREQKAQSPLTHSRPSRSLRVGRRGGMRTKWLGVRPRENLATGRSLACMLISEGFEQRRGMKGLPCHKTTPVSGSENVGWGAKLPLRHKAFSDCRAHDSSRQLSALPAFLGSLSELLPRLFSAYQLLFILQSPSLNTSFLGGAPPGLMFSPTFNPGDAPAPQQAPHAVCLIP